MASNSTVVRIIIIGNLLVLLHTYEDCGPTPEPKNFSRLIETTGTSYGSSSLFECMAGYETSVSLNISCNSNGTWETAPSCTIKGYETQDSLNISCDSNGVWENPPTCTIKGKLLLTGSVGKCGEQTRLNCTGDNIRAGAKYIFHKLDPNVTITDNSYNDKWRKRKYRAVSGNGIITLYIKQTDNYDAGQYLCHHNFEESNVIKLSEPCSNSGTPGTFCFHGLILLFLGIFIVKGLL